MRYQEYINKFVRIISVVIYRNGRLIKTEYYGTLIKENESILTIVEKDNNEVNIQKRFVKRVEEYNG